jgi:hypothetical protein
MSIETPTVFEAHDHGITGLWYRAGSVKSGLAMYYRVVSISKSAHSHFTVKISVPCEHHTNGKGHKVVSMPMHGGETLHRFNIGEHYDTVARRESSE